MPRRRRFPSYRQHKSSGQAVVTLGGRDVYLGKHDTAASHDRYRRVIAEWLANHEQTPASSTTGAMPDGTLLTVSEIFLAYWRFCSSYYVKDGNPTGETANVKDAVRPLIMLFGDVCVRDARPPRFRTVYVKRWWLRLFDRVFGVDCFGAAFRHRGRGLSTCDAGF
jgi:hypothetical protein